VALFWSAGPSIYSRALEAADHSVRTRGRALLRAVPRPLALLLIAVALFGVAWALVIPPEQVPDEGAHMAYAQTVAVRHELPGSGPKSASTEEAFSMGTAVGGQLPGNPTRKPEWRPSVFKSWRSVSGRLPQSDGGGPFRQDQNPPLYYGFESLPYWAVGGHFFDRLYAMRLWSSLMLLVTTTGAWLLAGEVFGRNRVLQLGAAAIAGLQPMVTFISSGVNPDSMLFAFWSISLWLGVRIMKRGLTLRDGVAFGLVVGFAVTEKATSWALVPAAILVVAQAARRLRARGAPGIAMAVAATTLAFAVPAGSWVVTAAALHRPVANQEVDRNGRTAPSPTSIGTLREFGSYVWQFYLPRLWFQTPFFGQGPGGVQLRDTWINSGWAQFGWLEVRFPPWVYRVLEAFSILAIAGGIAALGRAARRRRVDWSATGFLVVASLALLLLLHWAEYTIVKLDNQGFLQGRYILPLIPLGGLAVAGAISLLRRRWQGLAVAIVLAGLVILQLGSLAITVDRYFV
jgi:4-amino-4-deoxy-L-arabinose transferase-like glycosyltransferase